MGKKRGKSVSHDTARPVNPERVDVARKRQQKLLITWSIIIIALALTTLFAYQLWPRPDPQESFAQCLTEKGAVMYGTDWCGHCQAQKRMFGDSFKEVTFVNCDYSKACAAANITGYPTWVFADGSRLEGQVSLETLAQKTGCTI